MIVLADILMNGKLKNRLSIWLEIIYFCLVEAQKKKKNHPNKDGLAGHFLFFLYSSRREQ